MAGPSFGEERAETIFWRRVEANLRMGVVLGQLAFGIKELGSDSRLHLGQESRQNRICDKLGADHV